MSVEKNIAEEANAAATPESVQINSELQNDSEASNASEELSPDIDPNDSESKPVDTNKAESADSDKSKESDEQKSKTSLKTEETSDMSEEGSESDTPKALDSEEAVEEPIDYSSLNKEELFDLISELSENFNLQKSGEHTNHITDAFNALIQEEESNALKKFIAEGGKEEDFEYFAGDLKAKFDECHKSIKGKRQQHYRGLDKEKEENLKIKNELLDKLREIVDNEESSSLNELKKLQQEWKSAGPVKPQHNKTLWANYHALLDRFYDHRSIYFELKDLDRKKNLESKVELCTKAEELNEEQNLHNAIRKLNELHEEFKHIGPVPREDQEGLWMRFKSASDVVYAKRKEHNVELLAQLKENLNKKLTIVDEIQGFTSFSSDVIGDWNSKTKEVLELQKKWESTGGMPKENAKKVNKQFWGHFKQFFHNKSAFFKTLESQREGNLEIKLELLEKAEQLASSQEWDKTSNEFIKLQNDWKNTGPVPEKSRKETYKKFKTACDTFFTQKRAHNKELNSEYDLNLKKKEEICSQLEVLAQGSNTDTEKVYELQEAFNSIGFVPRKAIKKIQNKYNSAIQALKDNAKDLNKEDLDAFKTAVTINEVKTGPNADQKIQRQEYALRRKITNLENDVSTWKNNLAFFNNSKNAQDLLKDFEQKIENSEKEIVKLKAELRLFQTL